MDFYELCNLKRRIISSLYTLDLEARFVNIIYAILNILYLSVGYNRKLCLNDVVSQRVLIYLCTYKNTNHFETTNFDNKNENFNLHYLLKETNL